MGDRRIIFLLMAFIYSFNSWPDLVWNIKTDSEQKDINPDEITLALDFNKIKAKSINNKIIESLEIEGLNKTSDFNLPQVPFKSFLITGHDVKLRTIKGNKIKLLNAQKNRLRTFKGEKCRCKNVLDNISRSSVGSYRDLVTQKYVGDFRGQKIYKIDLTPIEFDGNDIYVYPNLKVIVEKGNNVREFDNEDITLNKKMLIIAPSIFSSELQTFINFKQRLGFKINTTYLSDKISFDDLKKLVHKQVKEQDISYLILVGNEKIIPTNYVLTTFDRNTPSDLELVTTGGVGDYVPDLLSSRISVADSSDLRDWIQKTIYYEQTAVPNLRTMALASNEGTNPSDVDYVKSMAKPLQDKFNAKTTYFFQGSKDSNPENISEVINQGVDYINYIGHGSGVSWPSITEREMTSDHLKSLKNDKRFPVVIDVACQNGRFSGEERFGESFINGPSGAVAYYGGSVDISWDPPAIMAIGISNELKQGRDNILGLGLLRGQLYLMKNYSDFTQVKYNLIWYHLQGDPSLKLHF